MAAGLPLFLVLRKKRLFTSDLVEKREKMPPTLFLKIFVVAMGAQWIFSAVSMVFEYVLGQFGLSAMTLYASSMNALMNPIGLLYAMLLGPIMEEIIFRGAIMKHLERFGANYAIVMSSLFFGLYHIYLYQAAFAFLVGAILAYTAHRYSIRWSMLLHILINSSALGTEFLFGAETAIYVMFAICIVSVFLLVRNRSILREQIARGKPAMPNAFRYAFSGVSVIVVFAAFIVANITMIAVSTQ
jgi:membrane protease YdiL (CAAX protease family)